ncbi:MAG: ABC transporter permease [Thermomicrobiales bacterium]|nr:ABC transporter permease [Thermomicrobiales bacterium]
MTDVATSPPLYADDQALGRKTRIESPARQVVRRFARHKLAMTGLIVLVFIILACLLAPLIASHDPDTVDLLARNQGPSREHPFGTDRTGRDTFARVLYAGRVSLAVGLGAVAISVAVGMLLGSIAGFFGGRIDNIIMRFTDVMMTFPPVVIILTVAAIAGPGVRNTMLIIGLLNWPVPCRLVRAKFLTVREMEYVSAARSLGVPTKRIIGRHALPNVVDVIIVYATLGMANAILLEAGMSFLGVGVQPPTPSWGNMLNVARNISVLEGDPWQWMPAGVAIVLTVLAVNLIGDGLRDALDPRMKI